jgi:C4-dicarboxylate transporter, DctM subunit
MELDGDAVAILTFVLMFALMLVRVPIGIAMGISGIIGYGLVVGWEPAFALLGQVPISTVTDYKLSLIPMFILMGSFASASGLSRELFHAGDAWLGHLRGGLCLATIAACGGFAAINGSSVATAATMTNVALPEMRRAGYEPGLASGLIAAGGTLGIMVPPSVILVLYSIMTETDIFKLFAAGIIPAFMAMVMYAGVVQIIGIMRPEAMPRGRRHSWAERLEALRGIWAAVLLFSIVFGGMFSGIFLVSEAAGVGAIGALLIGVLRGRLTRAGIMTCLVSSLRVSASIMVIVIGAYLFGYALTVTQATQKVVDLMVHLPIGPYGVLTLVMLGYLLLGAIMDELAMILLTVPIVFPAMMQLGFDPVWFGVIIVMACTLGMICPPVGMNVFVINSIARDISLIKIYRGTMPFIASDMIRLVILCAFPAISLFLPRFFAG